MDEVPSREPKLPTRRKFLQLTAAAALADLGQSEEPLRIGMLQPEALDTASDQQAVHGILRLLGDHLCDNHLTSLEQALALGWQADEATRTWRFRLRENVRCHDGAEFTAGDAAAALDHFLRMRPDLPFGQTAVRIEAEDSATLRAVLPDPCPMFPFLVSSINPHALLLCQGLVGTGPYRIASFDRGRGARLLRHNACWREIQGDIPAELELTFFHSLSEAQTAFDRDAIAHIALG
jgi:peptide/nickel transport system substrate-binding protein